jgi:hypothetical protein
VSGWRYISHPEQTGMQVAGALLIVLAGVCEAILRIYAIPAEERMQLRETADAVGTRIGAWNQGCSVVLLLFVIFGFARTMLKIEALRVVYLTVILGGGFAFVASIVFIMVGKVVVLTNTLPISARTALRITAVVLGTVGAIMVFLAGRI